LAQNVVSAVSPLMHLQPSSRQRELIARARRLARERFAPRADRHDRDASFPFDDYADLRTGGLLGLCVPERYGGLGADYETYCLAAEQLAQDNCRHERRHGHRSAKQ
jgi:alkylation response protein AidB-like acyl-CoA dehydrogenase